VLVADDHPTNRRVIELILAQASAEISIAENGAEAVEAFRGRDFDLVLMDMQMPVMDGLTATHEIRLHEAAMGGSRTPIVMLTANAMPEHIAAGRAAGADHHLAKPFNAAELLAIVADPAILLKDAAEAA
jgi:CheY-like chemotaxis protein